MPLSRADWENLRWAFSIRRLRSNVRAVVDGGLTEIEAGSVLLLMHVGEEEHGEVQDGVEAITAQKSDLALSTLKWKTLEVRVILPQRFYDFRWLEEENRAVFSMEGDEGAGF